MENQTNPILELRNVGLFYPNQSSLFSISRGKKWAIKDVSLKLYRGETLGIIGRNGSGKSTILSIMTGILKPDTGVFISKRLKILLLSLQVGFKQDLSGRDNIILSGILSGYSYEEILLKMEEIISFSGLRELIEAPLHTYSPGMRARLGFSIAFFTDPDVLLVDETLGVGDARFQKKSTAKMKERISSKKTVVLVSHSQAVIKELCDRVVWVENGETRMEGLTDHVLELYTQALKDEKLGG